MYDTKQPVALIHAQSLTVCQSLFKGFQRNDLLAPGGTERAPITKHLDPGGQEARLDQLVDGLI